MENLETLFWKQPESRRLEYKESLPKGDQLAKTVVAFANGAGGRVIFGVRSRTLEVLGVAEDDLFSLEEQISNILFDRCSPAIIPEIYIQAVEGKHLLVVEVFPGSHKPYYLKSKGKHKGTYIRVGSTNKLATEEMLEELERQRRKISFDAVRVYDTPWNDLDLSRFKADYEKATGRIPDEDGFKNLGLLKCERNHLHPTHAAVLLSDSPIRRHMFPYAKIECARFKGVESRVFLDQATVEGPLQATIEPCMGFIKKNIALSSRIGEIYREDRWEYPLGALREAVINAIIHRDYSILGSDIKVAIFEDMLEITSPGPLPDTMAPEKLGTGRSEIRNRVLAPIFKDLKLIEAWGTGILKMQTELSEYPEIELVLQELGHAFQVQFRKKRVEGIETGPSRDQVGTKLGPSWDQAIRSLGLSAKEVETICTLCLEPAAIQELMQKFDWSNRSKFRDRFLKPLLEIHFIEMTLPEKARSPLQQYKTTEEGRRFLKDFEEKKDTERSDELQVS